MIYISEFILLKAKLASYSKNILLGFMLDHIVCWVVSFYGVNVENVTYKISRCYLARSAGLTGARTGLAGLTYQSDRCGSGSSGLWVRSSGTVQWQKVLFGRIIRPMGGSSDHVSFLDFSEWSCRTGLTGRSTGLTGGAGFIIPAETCKFHKKL